MIDISNQCRLIKSDKSSIFLWVALATLAFSQFLSGCASTGSVDDGKQAPAQTMWPAPPEKARIQYLGSLKTLEDVIGEQKPSLRDKLLGKEQKSQALLIKPYGVNSDSKGRVYVADSGKAGLLVFDLVQKSFSTWGETGPGALKKPVGVTSDASGNVYVSDVIDKRVVVFDRDGNYLKAYGGKGLLESPAGLVFNDTKQRLYLVDVKKHQVLVFTNDGQVDFTIGERGHESGKFNYPTNISMDELGQLFVADSMNFRVQIFNANGSFVNTFGEIGNGPGSFSRLKGLGVDTEGHIYAVDAAFNNFQVLDQQGQLLLAVGRTGVGPDGFYLPAGAHVDKNNRIFVADQFNQRIQMFEYLGNSESP